MPASLSGCQRLGVGFFANRDAVPVVVVPLRRVRGLPHARLPCRELIPTPENRERSSNIRRAMKRKPGERWTPEALSLLVNDWRALGDAAGKDRSYKLRDMWGVKERSSIVRALERAETLGLLEPGEWQRRSS